MVHVIHLQIYVCTLNKCSTGIYNYHAISSTNARL